MDFMDQTHSQSGLQHRTGRAITSDRRSLSSETKESRNVYRRQLESANGEYERYSRNFEVAADRIQRASDRVTRLGALIEAAHKQNEATKDEISWLQRMRAKVAGGRDSAGEACVRLGEHIAALESVHSRAVRDIRMGEQQVRSAAYSKDVTATKEFHNRRRGRSRSSRGGRKPSWQSRVRGARREMWRG